MLNQIRKNSIYKIHRKYNAKMDHAEQVCKLSTQIFDKTLGTLHSFSENERSLLEAGSLLHDIGYAISATDHHKHSYTLIVKNQPEGFSPEEVEIIANIARYHRGKKPKKSHEGFSSLTNDSSKIMVKKLSSISRIADGLDRSHLSLVEDIDCIYDSFSEILYFMLKLAVPDCNLEILAAEKKKDLFEEEFGVQVRFKIR